MRSAPAKSKTGPDGFGAVYGGALRPYGGSRTRFIGTSHHGSRDAAALAANHPAVLEGRPLFPSRVRRADDPAVDRVLKSGVHNAKLGAWIEKGPWAGMPQITLTLPERATCPRTCELWRECLAPGTPVLTADLRWVPIETLSVGDRLAAFDEESETDRQHRMTRIAEVQAMGRASLPSFRVVTDQGTVVASEGHLWLRRRSRLCYRWQRTDALKIGDKLQFFAKPWETDDSYDAGRLRGFVEGEGCLGVLDSGGFAKARMMWAQRPTKLCAEIIKISDDLGFKTKRRERVGGAANTAITHVDLMGGWREVAAFIGRIRPTRMIERAEDLWLQHDIGGRGGRFATVLAIEPIGQTDVVTIQTSTATLVAGGFFTHNCFGNAMPAPERYAPGPALVAQLDAELRFYGAQHAGRGFAVRLHVLGDFYSLDYVDSWARWIAEIPALHVWGYTARRSVDAIGAAIDDLGQQHPDRWRIRRSVAPDAPHGPRQVTTIWRDRGGALPELPTGSRLCPQQFDRTATCGTCGLCWSGATDQTRIVFVGHGRNGGAGATKRRANSGATQKEP